MYQKVLLKDKSDISDLVLEKLPLVNVIGAYEAPKLDKDVIRILSVKFSKVGKKTFTDYKNLEWVICRSHGIDNVNIDEARKRNIGIISTSPTSKQCAAWIFDKIDDDDGILIFGDGAISKELQTRIKNFNIVNTKTDKADIDRYISECKNIIVTLPSNDTTTHYFNKDLFSKIKNKVTIISISRGEVFDNSALLEFINSDMFIKGHFDMISATGRDDLLKSDNMYYYEHTSWKFNNTNTNSDDIYASELKSIIDQCISGNVNQPQLNRTDVKWF